MGSFATRKSSNEHGFFIAVTYLNKIGEGRIRDLTGDVLFSVTFKCAMLIVIRKDPGPYWCIMPNNVLMCIENYTDLPRLWTKVLTPQVVANRTNWSFISTSIDVTKTLEPAPSIRPRPARRKNSRVVKFRQKTKNMNPEARMRVLSHELQTRVLYANLALKFQDA